MILIEHEHNLITSSLYKGELAIAAIYKVAQNNPDQSLMIYKKGTDLSLFKNAVNNFLKPYIIASSYTYLHKDLGYVEDTPFIAVSTTSKFPTWIKSTTAFTIHASLINQLGRQISEKKNLLYWINSISKLTRPLGVLSYQIPVYSSQQDQFNTKVLYRFVKQHYKARWVFMLLLCHLYYEKRLPLFAFAKAISSKKQSLKLDIPVLQKPLEIVAPEPLKYDVVIPTVGRSTYLKDVLKDLNHQSITPQKVIIVEQNSDTNSKSDLSFLQTESYDFKVIHEFTHITGACRARNEAISLTKAPWVLLFDDDVRVENEFSSQVKEFLHETNAKCVTFACLQQGETESMETFKQWESFGSGCSIVHRDVIEKCKFDMALEHGYGEDVDYGMQIRNAGYDVIYAPQIQILHLKAPIGGFRKPHVFPWQDEEIQPKPSPQIMYHRKKNYTQEQLLGYKMVQFFKTYGVFGTKNPWKHYSRYRAAWNASEKWASQL